MSDADATVADWVKDLTDIAVDDVEVEIEATEPESEATEAGVEPEQLDEATEADDESAEATADGLQPDDDTPTAAPAAPEEAGPTDEPKAPEIELRPFTFNVDKTPVEIPGLQVAGDFVVMPKEVWDRQLLPNWIANRGEWRRKERDFRRELESLKTQRSAKDAHYESVTKLFDEMVQGGEERLIEWAEGVIARYPVMKAEAEARYYKTVAEQAKAPPSTQVDQEEQAEIKQDSLRTYIDGYIRQQQALGLVDQTEVFDRLWNDKRLYKVADSDMTDANGQPIPRGAEYIDPDLFYGVLNRSVESAKRVRQPHAPAPAAERNAAATGRVTGKPAPQSPAQADSTASRSEPKKPQSRDEWEKSLARVRV